MRTILPTLARVALALPVVITVAWNSAYAGRPEPKDERYEDMPACVSVGTPAGSAAAILPVLGGEPYDYCHSRKDGVLTGIHGPSGGTYFGVFDLVTNSKEKVGGPTMEFHFPAFNPDPPIPVPDPPFDQPFEGVGWGPWDKTPVSVGVITARLGVEGYYTNLFGMTKGGSADTTLRMRLVMPGSQNFYDLNYGDVLWSVGEPDHWHPYMSLADPVLVTCLEDELGERQWLIQTQGAHRAYLCRTNDGEWGWIPVGIYSMPVSFLIVENN